MAADLVHIRHPGYSPYKTSSFPQQPAHSGTVAESRGDGGGWRKGEEQRQSQREREMLCCNAMLNSNMQCSHHGNGGSSEASHGAENVCFRCVLACKSLCVSGYVNMHLYICAKVLHKMQSKSHWRSSAAGVFNVAQERRTKTLRRSLKRE